MKRFALILLLLSPLLASAQTAGPGSADTNAQKLKSFGLPSNLGTTFSSSGLVKATGGSSSVATAGTDYIKPGYAIVWHNGASAGAYSTLEAAEAVAVSGDHIDVHAGTFTPASNANLAKSGVNWHFFPGSIVNWSITSASQVFLFDDNGSSVSYTVSGAGTFNVTNNGTGSIGVLHTNNTASTVHFDFDTITANGPNLTYDGYGVFQQFGTVYCTGKKLVARGYCLWWGDGDGYYNIQRLEDTSTKSGAYVLYLITTETVPGGQFWLNTSHIKCDTGIFAQSNQSTLTTAEYRVWITCQLLEVGTQQAIDTNNMFFYGEFEKIQENAANASGQPFINIHSGAFSIQTETYLHAMKIASRGESSNSGLGLIDVNYQRTGDTAFVHIDEIDDSNGLPATGYVECDGGVLNFTGDSANLSQTADAFFATKPFSGVTTTMNLLSMGSITTQGAKKHVHITGSAVVNIFPNFNFDKTKITGTPTYPNQNGSGQVVRDTSPALVTPDLGTPTAINLSNATSLAAAALPNPSSSTLGGVRSAAAVSHQWINSISTGGVPSLSQPASTDISGLGTFATQNYATPPIIGGTTPAAGTFAGGAHTAATALGLANTASGSAAGAELRLATGGSDILGANRTLTFIVQDSDRSLSILGNSVIDQDVSTGGNPIFGTVSTASAGLKSLTLDGTHYGLINFSDSSNSADRTINFKLNNSNRTVNLGGNFTTASTFATSGVFSTTITATATTNSTLPAGTHTLAGLDVGQSWTGIQNFTGGTMAVPTSSSAPGSPADGYMYVNTTDHHVYVYSNGSFKQIDN